MRLFADKKNFIPARDGKMPLKRNPVALALRLLQLVFLLGFSRHPGDLWLWLRSMVHRRRPLTFILPWLTFDATRAIAARLPPGARVFEFGSGHSTLYWAKHGCVVQAVEDDATWFDLLAPKVARFRGSEVHLEQTKAGYLGCIDKSSALFDLVLVDGSHRLECIAPAIRHLKPGGLLVIDNTDWHWFERVDDEVPSGWEKLRYPGWAPFIGHRSETSVWISPTTSALGASCTHA